MHLLSCCSQQIVVIMDRLIHKIEQIIKQQEEIVSKEQEYSHDDMLSSTSDCDHCSPNYEWGFISGMKDVLSFIKQN